MLFFLSFLSLTLSIYFHLQSEKIMAKSFRRLAQISQERHPFQQELLLHALKDEDILHLNHIVSLEEAESDPEFLTLVKKYTLIQAGKNIFAYGCIISLLFTLF